MSDRHLTEAWAASDSTPTIDNTGYEVMAIPSFDETHLEQLCAVLADSRRGPDGFRDRKPADAAWH